MMTRSTPRRFIRQYSWARSIWRTWAMSSISSMRSRTIGRSPEMPMRPQARLGARPADDGLGGCPEAPVGIEDRRGQALKVGRLLRLDVEMAQLHLGLGPGERLRPVEGAAIVVLVDEIQQFRARRRDHGPEGDPRDLARRNRHRVPQRKDRVEDRPDGVRERPAVSDRRGRADGAAAADETRPVGLVLRIGGDLAFDHGEMRRPDLAARRASAGGAWRPARRIRRGTRSRRTSWRRPDARCRRPASSGPVRRRR